MPQLWRSRGWPGFEAAMPFPYEQETCCLLAVLPADPLTDLRRFYFETHPTVQDICVATALKDYLYAVAHEQPAPKAKSRSLAGY